MAGPLLHVIPQKCLSTCMKAEAAPQRSFQGRALSEWARTASNTKGPREEQTASWDSAGPSYQAQRHMCHTAPSRQMVWHCPAAGQHHRLKGNFGFLCPTRSNLVFCSLNVMDVTVKGPRGITHTGQFPKGRRSVEFLFLQHLAWCLAWRGCSGNLC